LPKTFLEQTKMSQRHRRNSTGSMVMHLTCHSCPLSIAPVLQISQKNMNVTHFPYPSGDEAVGVIQQSRICSHPSRNEQKLLYKAFDTHAWLPLNDHTLFSQAKEKEHYLSGTSKMIPIVRSSSAILQLSSGKYFACVNLYAGK